MATINFTGLASGLDTRALIDAILQAERRPIERLQAKQEVFSQQRAAFEELRSKLSGLRGALRDLASERTFRGRTTNVSNTQVLRATAGTGAEVGTFDIEVTQLAAAHRVKSSGLAAADQALVNDGTITIQSGSKDPIVIEVSAATGNNSLQSIRDAIQAANAGVQAAVIFDGTDYRLTVRAQDSGVANALSISDTTNLGLGEPGNLISEALDAELIVEGLAITSASNRVTGVIPGVTLDLLAKTTGSPISVEVAQDSESVVNATQTLVTKYNEVIEFFNAQFSRERPGPLAADSTARRAQLDLQRQFTSGLASLPLGEIRSLASVGVSFDGRSGLASLDASKLRERLETHFSAVGDLFLSSGRATDPRIRFLSATGNTSEADHAVEITQAAQQASVVGSTAWATLASDEALTISVGGSSTTIDLASGQTLAEVVEAVNAALRNASIAATASADDGRLRITTRDYGSSTSLAVSSSLADAQGGDQTGFDVNEATASGVDVAGSIAGVEAIGVGQILTAAGESAASGMTLRVSASAADVLATSGDFGSVGFSRGLIDTIGRKVDEFVRLRTGVIDVVKEALGANLKGLDRDVARFEDRLRIREARLIQQFSAAERAISALQAQGGQVGRIGF